MIGHRDQRAFLLARSASPIELQKTPQNVRMNAESLIVMGKYQNALSAVRKQKS